MTFWILYVWPLTNYSDFSTDQTFNQFHDLDTELDLHRITSGFHGAFATGVVCQQGTFNLPDVWFRPHFRDLLMLKLLRQGFPNMPCLFSTFHLEYPRYFLDFAYMYFIVYVTELGFALIATYTKNTHLAGLKDSMMMICFSKVFMI